MVTSTSGRRRRPQANGAAGAAPQDAAPPAPDARAKSGRGSKIADDADGGLSLVADDGSVLHRATPEIADAVRFMLARLGLQNGNELPPTVGVISAVRGEGVTFTARTLALVLAHDYEQRVCLVDTNWATSSLAESERAGVAEVVHGEVPLAKALASTANDRLDILWPGAATPAQRPVIAKSVALAELFATLGQTYDRVIVDLPAVLATSDGLLLTSLCDAVVLVVRQGVTPETQVVEAIRELGEKLLIGVVLNASATKIPRSMLRRIPNW